MSDIDQLARDLRADSGLRDIVAMALATNVPGDWDAVIAELTPLGYSVEAQELQDKLRAAHDTAAPHAAFMARWL